MLTEIQQLHVKHNFFLKLRKSNNYKCELSIPSVNSIPVRKRVYDFTGSEIIVNDSYQGSNISHKIPIYLYRPTLLLDVVLQSMYCNISSKLILLYSRNNKLLAQQDIFKLMPMSLDGEQAKLEKELISELPYIISRDFRESQNSDYLFLQNCSMNGGLV